MCNAKHLLTTALNVLKMIKQEGNFSQQALTDGFSNNELTFGAAWGWERESCTGSGTALGLKAQKESLLSQLSCGPSKGIFWHALIIYLTTATGTWQWDGEVWWPLDIPFSEQCLEPLPHPLGPSGLFWGCEGAEQSSDAGEERRSSTQRGRGH